MDFVRMQGGGFDVSWTKDGNLFQTLANSYAGGVSAFVDAVIASVPSRQINDTANPYDTPEFSGHHTLSSSDFNLLSPNPKMNWYGANAFITYLNTTNYGGSRHWRLPTVNDTNIAACSEGTICGYDVNSSTSEMATLYFDELGKKSAYNASGQLQQNYGIFFSNSGAQVVGNSVGPFNDFDDYLGHWSSTEDADQPANAWFFDFETGYQGMSAKDYYMDVGSVLAVTPGQVSAVPLPGAVWLFGTGMLGLLGSKRRIQLA